MRSPSLEGESGADRGRLFVGMRSGRPRMEKKLYNNSYDPQGENVRVHLYVNAIYVSHEIPAFAESVLRLAATAAISMGDSELSPDDWRSNSTVSPR